MDGLFLEIAVEQAFESATVASLVTCHFVYGVVDSVEVVLLSQTGDAGFVLASTAFSHHAFLKVGLGIPYHFANQFAELGSMLSLFPCIALESLGNFGIAFAVGLTAHGQIHTYLCALTVEVFLQALHNLFGATLSHAQFVSSYKFQALFLEFLELRSGNSTLRALFRCAFAFMYIAAYGANKFLFIIPFVFRVLIPFYFSIL